MIIFELVLFLLISSIIVVSIIGYGHFIAIGYKTNYLENLFFGFIFVGFIITTIHLFIKINFYINLLIIFFGFIFSLKQKIFVYKNLQKKHFLYLLIFILLTIIFVSQKYHEDFGYYHLPYIISLFENKIIFGLANANSVYSYNSIWLNTMSLFYLPNNNYNFITFPSFIIYSVFIIFFFKKIVEHKEKKLSYHFLILSLFYLIIKFTRLSEFGTDIPSILFSILSIFYFLSFLETNETNKKKYYFFCNFSFGIFAILIKLSCIPVILLTLYLFIKNNKILLHELFKINFIFIYFFSLIYFFQQFVYSGCFIFPSTITCFDVSWFNSEILSLKKDLELGNKSYSSVKGIISKEEYLSNFNWLYYWLHRNYIEILEHVLTMLIPISLLSIFSKNNNSTVNLKFKNIRIFLLFIFVSLIFWLQFSPVFRFGVAYFLSIIFILTINLYIKKEFSKKSFIILILIALTFNFSKNIVRLSNNEDIYFGIVGLKNTYLLDSKSLNDHIVVYKPDTKNNKNGWQGRLCWDIPFLCSYNSITIKKKYSYLFFNKLNN
tara:strand:- start:139 stop:1785 length:1647 start_codon:yes stop_codon:yes gene_type:complete